MSGEAKVSIYIILEAVHYPDFPWSSEWGSKSEYLWKQSTIPRFPLKQSKSEYLWKQCTIHRFPLKQCMSGGSKSEYLYNFGSSALYPGVVSGAAKVSILEAVHYTQVSPGAVSGAYICMHVDATGN